MKKLRYIAIILSILCLPMLLGCKEKTLYTDISDLTTETIGIYHADEYEETITQTFPQAEINHYDKALSLFVDIEASKCDVAIIEEELGNQLLNRNGDYGCLGYIPIAESDTRLCVIVEQSMIATTDQHSDIISSVGDRVYRNFLSSDALKLILGGFYTTLIIFVFGGILAIALGAFLAYLSLKHKWLWIYKPLSWFVMTVHDIPSVVLMMLFYYVIFYGSVHGIVASIVALGVYTSGSLYKIFKIHVSQVGKEQKEAAQLLGLTPFQTFRHITLPQAYKTMMPLVGGELKLLLRSTSYAGYIAQKDLVKAVDAIRALTFDSFVPLLIVSLIYLLLSWLIGKGLNLLYVKFIKHD